TEPAQSLGLDPTADALQGDLVVSHCLGRHGGEVLFDELVEDRIDLLEGLLGGPIPPHPTHRTHVCSVANRCSGVKQIYRQIGLRPPPVPHPSAPVRHSFFPVVSTAATPHRCGRYAAGAASPHGGEVKTDLTPTP